SLGLETQIYWQNLKNWADNPVRYHTGDSASGHVRRFFGLEDAINNPTVEIRGTSDPRGRIPSPYPQAAYIPRNTGAEILEDLRMTNSRRNSQIPYRNDGTTIVNNINYNGERVSSVVNRIP